MAPRPLDKTHHKPVKTVILELHTERAFTSKENTEKFFEKLELLANTNAENGFVKRNKLGPRDFVELHSEGKIIGKIKVSDLEDKDMKHYLPQFIATNARVLDKGKPIQTTDFGTFARTRKEEDRNRADEDGQGNGLRAVPLPPGGFKGRS